jgi:beta-lactamase class A
VSLSRGELRLASAILWLAFQPAFAQDRTPFAEELRRRLTAELDRIAADLDGVMGYSVTDLTTGERWGRLETAPFPAMSTIKVAVLYELLRQADEGRLKLADRLRLDRRHAVGGSGVLNHLGTPELSLEDHARLMVALSDNTATNVLIEAVGMERVNARLEQLGFTTTRLKRRMMDLEALQRGLENLTSPAELARLFEIAHRGEGLSAASKEAMLSILKLPKTSPLRRGVPEAIEVASKPGWDEASVWADGGVVYAKGRPYVLAAMTTYLKSAAAGASAIEDASRTAYDYFSRVGAASEHGRRIR